MSASTALTPDKPVVPEHEEDDGNQPRYRCGDSLAYRVRAERRAYGPLFDIADFCRQRARSQDERQIFGGLLSEAARDLAPVGDLAR